MADPQSNDYIHSSFLLCNEAMHNLSQFLDFYGNFYIASFCNRSSTAKTASELRQQLREKQKQLIDLNLNIDTVERQIDQLRSRLEYDSNKRFFEQQSN